MIDSIIVDDELKNILILKSILADFCPDVNVLAEAQDMNQAIAMINMYKPQLLFLDIEMPYGNAFDLLDKLMPVNFEVIFITAFDEYALKAFRYSALDYLLKPININELKTTVKKAIERISTKNNSTQLKNLLQNLQNKNEETHKIALQTKDGLEFFIIEDIIRCEANGAYTYFFIKAHSKIIASKNIKEYEKILPEKIFFRIHHSHIINLKEIKRYHRGRGGYVEMKDGTFIDVAVRRKDEFLERIQQ
ncbi:MAG TPA: LytTR family DNA-binding domain-containing protein [Puia sp.]|nr:LytTR family DNA-binding domain-containing protein [Puia sp.]